MNPILVSLKEKLNPIADLIKDKNDVFYFDYPLHLNVGDLLIYQGTEQFFVDHQIKVRLKRSEYDFDLNEIKQKITPNTTILCHGGGNFGDLYPNHQNLRESLVKNFPHHRIIILPQTLYFKQEENRQKSAALFKQHNDCHLLARDVRTEKAFQQFSANVRLSPDMAHQLYGQYPTHQQAKQNTHQQLYFLRKDVEASEVEKNIIRDLPQNSNVKDWEDILSKQDSIVLALSWRIAHLAKKYQLSWLKNGVNKVWQSYTLKITQRVAKIFLHNDKITTTRLHGHIFSCLLEIPNQVCDNSYGKNTGYATLWTKDLAFVELPNSNNTDVVQ